MRIVTDSSCDLTSLEGCDFISVPLNIYTDERNFTDDEDLDMKEMITYLEAYKGRSYTSCPSIDAYRDSFEGADEILVFTVTGSLSGSYNAAVAASELYREEHPHTKISVIDTLSTGAEEILLLHKTRDLILHHLSFEEIETSIRSYMKSTRLLYSFFSVHNLAQNGRISKAAAASLSLLNIAVYGTASEEGKITVLGKARGEKKALRTLFQQVKELHFNGRKAIITHALNEEGAKELKAMILNEYPNADIDIFPARGLCSYYMERKGVVLSFECEDGHL